MLPPCTVDEVNIKLRVKELLDVEERLRKAERAKDQIREDADVKITSLMGEIDKLRGEIQDQQKQNDNLLQRLVLIEEKAKSQQAQNFIVTTFEKYFRKNAQRPEAKTRAGKFIQRVQGLFL